MVSKEKINARQLYKDDNWFRDPYGRYVMFRGVNFGARSKLAPYLPISPLKAKMISPQELTNEIKSVTKELDLMKESGFNVVRFLLSWKALEPRPNTDLDHRLLPEGEEYLRLVRQIVDELYSRDILVLFDFHQDIAHELAGGDGFPDWALALHDQVKRPDKPAKNNKLWAASYQLNKLVKNTLSSFYHNDLTNDEENLSHYPVRTHLERTIGQTIRFFKNLNGGEGHPAILGVDLFNEPHPVGIDKYEFESKLLKEFYLNAFHEIRKYDDKIFVFIEPRVDWTAFSSEEMNKQLTGWEAKRFDLRKFLRIGDMEMVRTPLDKGTYTQKGLMDAPKEINTYLPGKADWPAELLERGVFSFHYYDTRAIMSSIGMIPDNISKYKQDWPDVFERIVTAGYERDLIPFLTEFGGTHKSELVAPYINLQYIQVESQLLNSTYWNYDLYHTEDGKDNWNLENFSLLGPRRKPRHLDLATRPYPILSSSKPVFLSFDVKNKYFSLVLQGGGNAIASEGVSTVIYIPRIIHYQNGFNVWSTTKSRESIEWDPVDQLLYWNPTKELGPDILLITGTEDIDANKLHNEVRNSFSDLTPLGRIV